MPQHISPSLSSRDGSFDARQSANLDERLVPHHRSSLCLGCCAGRGQSPQIVNESTLVLAPHQSFTNQHGSNAFLEVLGDIVASRDATERT